MRCALLRLVTESSTTYRSIIWPFIWASSWNFMSCSSAALSMKGATRSWRGSQRQFVLKHCISKDYINIVQDAVWICMMNHVAFGLAWSNVCRWADQQHSGHQSMERSVLREVLADALSWFEWGGAECFQARKWNTEQFISHSLWPSISGLAAFGFKNCVSLPKRRHRCFGRPSCHCTGSFSSPIFGTCFHLCSNLCEGFHESISAFAGSRCPCRDFSHSGGIGVQDARKWPHSCGSSQFFRYWKVTVCNFMHVFHIYIYIYLYIYIYRYVVAFVSFVSEKGLYTHGNIAHALAVYRAEEHILTAKKETFGLGAI